MKLNQGQTPTLGMFLKSKLIKRERPLTFNTLASRLCQTSKNSF